MAVFSVQDLINRAAAAADMHDTFVTPQTWLAWYNVERQAFALAMARSGAALQDLTFQSFPAAATLSMPGPILAIVGVWEQQSDGRLRPLKIVSFPDNYRQGLNTGPAQYVTIDEASSTLSNTTNFRLYPTPTSGTYVVVTLAAPEVATDVSSTTSIPMGLEERIVAGMTKRALMKEESDISAVKEAIAECDKLIEEYGWKRIFAQMPSVRNVDRLQRGWIDEIQEIDPNLWYYL